MASTANKKYMTDENDERFYPIGHIGAIYDDSGNTLSALMADGWGAKWYNGTAMSGTSTTTGYYSYSACPQVKVGDYYLNTSYGYVYRCTTAGSGTTAKWTYQGSIRGATGTGTTGQRGSKWFTGTAISGTEANTNYVWNDSEQKYVGDMYLNTTYGYVYKCTTAGTYTTAKWTYQGTIKGDAGESVESSTKFLDVLEIISQTINPTNMYQKYDICSGSINQDKYLVRSMDWEDGVWSNRSFFNGMNCTVLCVRASNVPTGCTLGILSTDIADVTWNGIDNGQATERQFFRCLKTSNSYYRVVEIDYEGTVSYGSWQSN